MRIFYDCIKLLEIIIDLFYNHNENIFFNYLLNIINYSNGNINFNFDFLIYFIKNNTLNSSL